MDLASQPGLTILLVHNNYQQRGGEDVVAEAEAELLRAAGHEVFLYQRHNDELKSMPPLAAGLSALWPRRAARELAGMCDIVRPDLIHVHNTFPLIAAAPHWAARRRGIPVVQTLHNFRLLCPQAMLLRDGKICRDCVGRLPWRAVARSCYHDSLPQSAAVAGALAAHRLAGSYRHPRLHFIAPSRFSRDQFIAGGLPASRLHVKPNFVTPAGAPDWRHRAGGLYVGRLAEEKGARVLAAAAPLLRAANVHAAGVDAYACGVADALATASPPAAAVQPVPAASPGAGRGEASALGGPLLRIAGDGPLAPELARAWPGAMLGRQTPEQVRALLHGSLFLVAPSICLETFGLSAVEAFSCGTPVIASAHGGLGELVEDGVTGLHVKPGCAADLAAKIAWACANPEAMLRMGRTAYARYLAHYTPERNLATLLRIYHAALSAQQGERHEA
ncbi:glycosyltransferase [Pseudoduganella namucuonensis]|uniref:Glycosyltransferase involved in cell wall bisynthesis n=1 Tax=Pseudoduganella namucuonensis TaxID=1035707 RepID=A0A1I7K2P0_9BURK|nr:glycosyltransferase [Pseudoduganella namucuonensis]SFU91635.1 Glycosyltransferase involved in cell wall bisynthesis [Pseudoduganella namucuonensis]